MFSDIFSSQFDEVLLQRLKTLQEDLRGLQRATREEYQSEVYSRVNSVLASIGKASPLLPIPREGPAVVGNVNGNLALLNDDARGIVSQLLRIEGELARLFNFSATSQNDLRQQIREQIFAQSLFRYVEPFISRQRLEKTTAMVDFNAGVASLPLLGEVEIVPDRIVIGPASVGSLNTGTDALLDGKLETRFVWDGAVVELRLEWDEPQIINRLQIDLDDYEGLQITELTSSPDGSLREDILAELRSEQKRMDGSSSKFSGDVILDIVPRHVKELRLVITDLVDVARIALRGVRLFQRRYESVGQVQTTKIEGRTGNVDFTATQNLDSVLTSISHQISTDGVHFQSINSGDRIVATNPFWYRAVLERKDALFSQQVGPLIDPTDTPDLSADYKVTSTTSVEVGGGLLERTLSFEFVNGPVVFRESPLPGTLAVFEGSVQLDNTAFTFGNNTLTFPSNKTNITVRYQTSLLGPARLTDRQEFYSPYLHLAEFKKVIV